MYTIYESIGKSVVVPYCGSKTINVRLTVSPDAKVNGKKSAGAIISRKYRYKSRKLIPTEDDDVAVDVAPEKSIPRVPPTTPAASPAHHTAKEQPVKLHITEQDVVDCFVEQNQRVEEEPACCRSSVAKNTQKNTCPTNTPTSNGTPTTIRNNCATPITENVYESIPNLKCCSPKPAVVAAMQRLEEAQQEVANYSCRECSSQCPLLDNSVPSTKPRKLMRKSRSKKQKSAKTSHARVRSLSVGNENCYRNNNINSSVGRVVTTGGGGGDGGSTGRGDISGGGGVIDAVIVDGGDECLNNLRRNDLIDIIRESMEKNRLCFQSNG